MYCFNQCFLFRHDLREHVRRRRLHLNNGRLYGYGEGEIPGSSCAKEVIQDSDATRIAGEEHERLGHTDARKTYSLVNKQLKDLVSSKRMPFFTLCGSLTDTYK